MLSFDKKFALLRRRLIQSLRYLKMYAEHIDVEYTDEEFEVNVRPSLPFSTLGKINGEASVAFYEVNSARSVPVMLKEALEASMSIGASNPLTYPMNWNLKSSVTSDGPVITLDFLKPLGFDMDNLYFNSGFRGNVGFVNVVGIDTVQNMVGDIGVKTNFINMPRLYPEISIPVNTFVNTEITQQYPLLMKPAANEMCYADNFEVVLQYIRPTHEWSIRGIGDLDVTVSKINLPRVISDYDGYASMDFAPSMFQRTTMAALGDKTLTELENMPTEVGYVLITYTDDDYPWEV
jgi:hypothetical protein